MPLGGPWSPEGHSKGAAGGGGTESARPLAWTTEPGPHVSAGASRRQKRLRPSPRRKVARQPRGRLGSPELCSEESAWFGATDVGHLLQQLPEAGAMCLPWETQLRGRTCPRKKCSWTWMSGRTAPRNKGGGSDGGPRGQADGTEGRDQGPGVAREEQSLREVDAITTAKKSRGTPGWVARASALRGGGRPSVLSSRSTPGSRRPSRVAPRLPGGGGRSCGVKPQVQGLAGQRVSAPFSWLSNTPPLGQTTFYLSHQQLTLLDGFLLVTPVRTETLLGSCLVWFSEQEVGPGVRGGSGLPGGQAGASLRLHGPLLGHGSRRRAVIWPSAGTPAAEAGGSRRDLPSRVVSVMSPV